PSDFAEDDRTTPFNVARAIDLTGFTLEQLRPLRAELPPKLQEDVVLRRVLYWTGGQPLLTHKLCAHLAGHSDPIPSDATGLSQLVDTVTRERVISGWENAEDPEHLQTIRERFDRLLERDQTLTTKMLNLYAKVLAAEDGLEVGRTREELELRLTGLVVARDDRLRSTNQIYREVFGPEWLKRQLKRLRPYHEAFEAWKRSKREDTSRLLEGQALKEGLTWSEERSIGEDERAFLRASQARVDARRRRFQRITLVVAGALLLAFVVSVALYFRLEEQTRQARENYDRANSERDRANAEKERASLEKDRANVERERASQEAAQRRVEADSARAGWAEAQRQQGIATAEKEKAIEETKNARDAEAKANYQSKLAFENAKQRDEEAKRAREAEAVAVKNTARIQAQYDSLASSLAECTTLEGQLTRARAEVDRLRKQCSPGESGVRAPSGR
ncbi:MAG TPA: hypothetical protein VGK73_23500, partial [Polyangiaceae bacterium]